MFFFTHIHTHTLSLSLPCSSCSIDKINQGSRDASRTSTMEICFRGTLYMTNTFDVLQREMLLMAGSSARSIPSYPILPCYTHLTGDEL